MEKIRLNQQKRQLLKKEWQHTVYNNMPMQVERDGRGQAVRGRLYGTNFYSGASPKQQATRAK